MASQRMNEISALSRRFDSVVPQQREEHSDRPLIGVVANKIHALAYWHFYDLDEFTFGCDATALTHFHGVSHLHVVQ